MGGTNCRCLFYRGIHLIEVSIKRKPTVKMKVLFLLLVSLGMERMGRKGGKRPTQSEFLYIVFLYTDEANIILFIL